MSTQTQTQVKAPSVPKPTFSAMQPGLLQRKCACGSSPGVDGECAECRKKRLSLQRRAANQAGPATVQPIVHDVQSCAGQPLDANTRALMGPRFGHDFSRVQVVHSPRRQGWSGPGFMPTLQTLPARMQRSSMTYQVAVGEDPLQDPDGLDPTQDLTPPGAVTQADLDGMGQVQDFTAQGRINIGSGTCSKGKEMTIGGETVGVGGLSFCDTDAGGYVIQGNFDECCTTKCTQEHEQQHVDDHTRWGCCKAYSQRVKELKQKGFNRSDPEPNLLLWASNHWSGWTQQVRAITECRAYKHNIACAEKLARENNCAAQQRTGGQQSDCCLDIDVYQRDARNAASAWCEQTARQVPPCPFTGGSPKKG